MEVEAEAASSKLQDVRGSVTSGLALLYARTGRVEEAIRKMEEALALRRTAGQERQIAVSLRFLGEFELVRRDWAKAGDWLRQSEEICRRIGDQDGVAMCLSSRAKSFLSQGLFAESLALHRDAIARIDRQDSPLQYAEALRLLGGTLHAAGQLREALEAFERSESEIRRIENAPQLLECLLARGLCLLDLGRLDDSARASGEAHRRMEGGASPDNRHAGLILAAEVSAASGKQDEALTFLGEAVKAAQAGSPPPLDRVPFRDRLRLMSDEARIRQAAGDRDGALRVVTEALGAARGAGALLQAGHFERLLEELK